VPLRSALQSELVDRIKDFIRTNGFAERGRIREAWLSRTLGVSRTPIQAALQHLLVDGVLTRHPHGGYLVARMPTPANGSLGGAGDDADLYGRVLRDIIVNNAPDAVSDRALMRHYGVGRGEILQVLRRLMREGLAEPSPGRGWTEPCGPEAYSNHRDRNRPARWMTNVWWFSSKRQRVGVATRSPTNR